MKSLTPAEKFNFSTPSVIAALDTAKPVLWRKASPRTKYNLDSTKVVDIVRSHELNLILDMPEWEIEENEEGFIETDAVCSVEGYQAYVEQCVINYYS